MYTITQNKLTDEIKKKIFQGFARQAVRATGIDGLAEESVSFEIFQNSEFVGAIAVQFFWDQLHIKYLFVEEKYRGQGIAKHLMKHALEFGKNHGCGFAFVETMSFQAPAFYKKMGFVIDFSRDGYAKNTAFHYLKKDLNATTAPLKVTRVGVYGVGFDNEKILLIQQIRGPHSGKLDFPGGGIEFGESAEGALCREFEEEVACGFGALTLLDNLTAVTEVAKSSEKGAYTLYQIGMIYEIIGLHPLKGLPAGEFEHKWIDPISLSQERCTPLLWLWLRKYFDKFGSGCI